MEAEPLFELLLTVRVLLDINLVIDLNHFLDEECDDRIVHFVFREQLLALEFNEIAHEWQNDLVKVNRRASFDGDMLDLREVNKRIQNVKGFFHWPDLFEFFQLQALGHQPYQAKNLGLLKVVLLDPLIRGLHTGG